MAGAKSSCKEYPASPQGDQISYPTYDCTWQPNVAFHAQMTLLGMSRGYSSATFHWASADGRQWTMFMVDVAMLIKGATLDRGAVSGWWRVRKRGKNYGIEYLGEIYEVVA